MSRKATGVEICAILMILIGLMYLITYIPAMIFIYIYRYSNGFDTIAALLLLLYPILLIVVGWELTNLKYWAWVCTIALIVIWIFKIVYDAVIYGAWNDILSVAIPTAILMYFLTVKTRSQFT